MTSQPERKSHRRRTSEPLDFPTAAAAAAAAPTVATNRGRTDRRDHFERHWSTNDVFQQQPMGNTSAASTATQWNVAQLQESWASSTDFLGGDWETTTASTNIGTTAIATDIHHIHTGIIGGHHHDNANTTPSTLHDAARITDWDLVLELCQEHPEWAAYTGPDQWTALHHACNRRCPHPHVVQALLEAFPEALTQPEKEKGWLPLHYACRFKAPTPVVNLLLHQFPDCSHDTVSQRDRLGRTPLFYAVRYDAPAGVVSLLLQIDPSVVLEEDRNDDSPLALVWDSWAEKLESKRMVHSFLPGGFPEPDSLTPLERAQLLRERLKTETKLRKKWNKANMLLKAAFGFPVEEDEGNDDDDNNNNKNDDTADNGRKWRVVHATAAVKCHFTLFQLACALHPEQVAELDQNDLIPSSSSSNTTRTALHLAAASNASGEAAKDVIITLLSLYRQAAEIPDTATGSLPLHVLVENAAFKDWPQHGAILCRFYPRAVQIPDAQGRLPLHKAAMAHGQECKEETNDNNNDDTSSVMVQLVRAFPQAAQHADQSGRLPLHHVAEHAQEWDDDLETLYHSHRPAIQARTVQGGQLPLHLAAANPHAKASLIQALLQHHPRAASLPNAQGELPLYLACAAGKEWDEGGTQLLYQAHPAALTAANANTAATITTTPLYAACASPRISKHLIEPLCRLHPAAVEMAWQGRYPLHAACASGQSLASLRALWSVQDVYLSTADANGCLPWQLAALRMAQDETTKTKKNKKNNRKDAHDNNNKKKKEDCQDINVLWELLRADPTTLRCDV